MKKWAGRAHRHRGPPVTPTPVGHSVHANLDENASVWANPRFDAKTSMLRNEQEWGVHWNSSRPVIVGNLMGSFRR